MTFPRQAGTAALLVAGGVFLAGCSNQVNPMAPNANSSRGISVMNADGTNRTRLTNVGGASGASDPSFSPDGSKIAFINPMNDGTSNTEVYIMNVDGSNKTRLTNDPVWEFAPSWSPDGSKIAFTRTTGSGSSFTSSIFVMNADGSSVTSLTSSTTWQVSSPCWSPDGSRIAFYRIN